MPKRPPVALAVLTALLLGTVLALPGLRGLTGVLLQRYDAFAELPRPRGVLWIAGLRGINQILDRAERPLVAVSLVLFLAALGLLARILNPEFRLTRSRPEGESAGLAAPLEPARILRFGIAAVASLWIAGAFLPFFTEGGNAPIPKGLLPRLLGGSSVWAAGVPGPLAPVAHALLLFVPLWLIWAGSNTRRGLLPTGNTCLWAALAGVAGTASMVLIDRGRYWEIQSVDALSLGNRPAWQLLLGLHVALTAAAVLVAAVVALLFRPRGAAPRALQLAGLGAAALLALALAGDALASRMLARLDLSAPGFRQALRLQPSPLQRYALVLTPDAGPLYSVTSDGTDDGSGGDQVGCNGASVDPTLELLRTRTGGSRLMARAYSHLYGCASLDWSPERCLNLSSEMVERFPTPEAMKLLLEKLGDCPIVPENRRILDRLADARQFAWPPDMERRWLGTAYLRFGELARARDYLLKAKLSAAEMRGLLGGISPLTAGKVSGHVQVEGEPAGVRVGLVRDDKWRAMVGFCPPSVWRLACDSTVTDAKGAFEFRNVAEGRYVLIITGAGIGRRRGQPVVSPRPSTIELDRFHAEERIPTFNLQFIRPTLPPAVRHGDHNA